MTPASFFAGAPPGGSGQKKEIEKPRPSPAGPRKSLYAVFSARETSLVHPLKVDSKMREVHTIVVAVQLKSRMTILLKCRMLLMKTADSRVACFRQFNFMAQPISRPCGALPTDGRPST
jgi:hypothetical protein